jgi:hypothetical protein
MAEVNSNINIFYLPRTGKKAVLNQIAGEDIIQTVVTFDLYNKKSFI